MSARETGWAEAHEINPYAVRWQCEEGYVHLTLFSGPETANAFAEKKAPYSERLDAYAWPPTFSPRSRQRAAYSKTGW